MPVGNLRAQLSRALVGDAEAVGWLYDQFAPQLSRKLERRFGPVPGLESADLLHDTFVYLLADEGRVLKRFLERPTEATEAAFAQFVWSAACGIASNRRRSLARHPTDSLDARQRTLATDDGEGATAARDVLDRLARCLLRRGDRSYLYYQLRYRDGLTPTEVARVTGWSQRATYKLKQALDRAVDRCLEEMGLSR